MCRILRNIWHYTRCREMSVYSTGSYEGEKLIPVAGLEKDCIIYA